MVPARRKSVVRDDVDPFFASLRHFRVRRKRDVRSRNDVQLLKTHRFAGPQNRSHVEAVLQRLEDDGQSAGTQLNNPIHALLATIEQELVGRRESDRLLGAMPTVLHACLEARAGERLRGKRRAGGASFERSCAVASSSSGRPSPVAAEIGYTRAVFFIALTKAPRRSRAKGRSILFAARICGFFASFGLYFSSSRLIALQSFTGSRSAPCAERSTMWMRTRHRSTWRRN